MSQKPNQSLFVIASNRGPLSFDRDATGALTPSRGSGGLVATLVPAVENSDAIWFASSVGHEADEAASLGLVEVDGLRVQQLAIREDLYRQYYDVISNGTLWFLHHGLFDLTHQPRFDRRWREAWDGYREVNHAYAQMIADATPENAVVLIHDYHLSLIAPTLLQKRPDVRPVFFSHIPFADPTAFATLPDDVQHELLESMASHRSCGFHTQRWAQNFTDCCEQIVGITPQTFASAAVESFDDLTALANSAECKTKHFELDEQIKDRKLILRTDRTELSKNILRGFYAYDDLLEQHPEWREQVIFAAFLYPTREGLAEYRAYRSEVDAVVKIINDRWSTPDWTPILLRTNDDMTRSVAALQRFDVLLVNPIRDGLNLVAEEGAFLGKNDGVIVLSKEAGVWDQLGATSISINPLDIVATSEALLQALEMSSEERNQRAQAAKHVALQRTPHQWLDAQLAAAETKPT